jgi:hypothetical protein
MELARENVRAEAARRGLSFRELMGLYYRQDPERATHLSLYWRVAPCHPEKLFGKSRVGQFVGDIRKFLVGAGIRLTTVEGEDPHGLDRMQELKKKRQELQEQRPQQGPGESKPRKRKRGGSRKVKDARRRARQVRTMPPKVLPPPADSLRYEDGDGNTLRVTTSGVRLEKAAKPPTKRARRSSSSSSSSSSASSSSSSSASSSSSSDSSASPSSGISVSSSYCDWLFASSSSSLSSSDSSSSSEDDHPSRAKPSTPAKGGGAVPAAEAASPPPELEVIYSKPPERVSDDR